MAARRISAPSACSLILEQTQSAPSVSPPSPPESESSRFPSDGTRTSAPHLRRNSKNIPADSLRIAILFSPFYLLTLRFGSLRALLASACKKSCFHPKPFLGSLTLRVEFETSTRNFGSNQMEFSPNFLFTTGSSSTRNSMNPYRSNPRTRNVRFRQKQNSP